MKALTLRGRAVGIGAGAIALLLLFLYVAIRSGPLAPVEVTMETVSLRAIVPALFGIGTVEPRFSYRVGPTAAGRVSRVLVDVGDVVEAGSLLAEMESIDLRDRGRAQVATVQRMTALLHDAESRYQYAASEATRYEQLLAERSTSEELVAARQQARAAALTSLEVARAELARAQDDRRAISAQQDNLQLRAPVAGLVAARSVDEGTTVVAGQTVIEVVDKQRRWIHVRFDQGHSAGLADGLPARITLRSRESVSFDGHIARVEPRSDAITEEVLAKVSFELLPVPLPTLGELAEVTVRLPAHPAAPAIPNAAIHQLNGQMGVWQVIGDDLRFTPVTLGDADLDGFVRVRTGVQAGDRIVVYSTKSLTPRSRVTVVSRLAGVSR